MKPTIACLLILTLVIPASAREQTPLQQAQKIAPGSRVVVTLKDKRTVSGSIGDVNENRLVLRASKPGDWSGELLFRDVSKVRLVQSKLRFLEKPLMPFIVLGFFGYCLGELILGKYCLDGLWS